MQSIISARLPATANPKGVTQLTLSAHTTKKRPQDITNNIYLNDNKMQYADRGWCYQENMELILPVLRIFE